MNTCDSTRSLRRSCRPVGWPIAMAARSTGTLRCGVVWCRGLWMLCVGAACCDRYLLYRTMSAWRRFCAMRQKRAERQVSVKIHRVENSDDSSGSTAEHYQASTQRGKRTSMYKMAAKRLTTPLFCRRARSVIGHSRYIWVEYERIFAVGCLLKMLDFSILLSDFCNNNNRKCYSLLSGSALH